MMKDYYYILGISETSNEQEIKSAFRKLSKKFHPDNNDGDKFFEARFIEIQEAYKVLSDNIRRRSYDISRKEKSTNEVRKTTAPTNQSPYYPPTRKQTKSTKVPSVFTLLGLLVRFIKRI